MKTLKILTLSKEEAEILGIKSLEKKGKKVIKNNKFSKGDIKKIAKFYGLSKIK